MRHLLPTPSSSLLAAPARAARLLIPLLLLSTAASAQMVGRLQIDVVSTDGTGVEGVEVTVRLLDGPEFESTQTSKRKGRVIFALRDATYRYEIEARAEGFDPVTTIFKPTPGETVRLTLELTTAATVTTTAPSGTDQPTTTLSNTPAEEQHNRGVTLLRTGDLDGALDAFLAAIELDPDLQATHSALAGLHLRRADHTAARLSAEELLRLDPKSARAALILYDVARATEDDELRRRADSLLKSSGALAQDPALLYNQGVEALSVGDLPAALRSFEAALELEPELVPALNGAARAQLELGQYAEAAASAQKVLELEPTDVRALRVRYNALEQAGDEAGARAALAALAEHDGSVVETQLFAKAEELFNANRPADSAQVLRELLNVRPDHAGAHYLLGLCLANAGDAAGAKAAFARYLELEPEGANAETARQMLEHL